MKYGKVVVTVPLCVYNLNHFILSRGIISLLIGSPRSRLKKKFMLLYCVGENFSIVHIRTSPSRDVEVICVIIKYLLMCCY